MILSIFSPCDACLDNKVSIACQGGVDAILQAMRSHQDHAGVQENACGALGHLAVNAGILHAP